MVGIFISVAVLLVVFGGLLAAADAALGVMSRTDLAIIAVAVAFVVCFWVTVLGGWG